MGFLDFFKPRKDSLQELPNQAEIRKAVFLTALEFTQKQISNLRAVGREAEAEKLLFDYNNGRAEFLRLTFQEWDKLHLPRPTPNQRAGLSYAIAYLVLPHQAYNEFDKFLGVWRRTMPPIGFVLCECACSVQKVRPTPELATAFKTYEVQLNSRCDYYILEFPPASLPAEIPYGKLIDIMSKSPGKTLVLAPYFAAIVDDHSGRRAYYVLGQRPGGGTTLRSVTADEVNHNLGPGPEPNLGSFLQCLTKRHVS